MLEEEAPDEVQPAERKPEECDEDRHHEGDEALRLEECGPSDKNFHDPVDAGDQEQDDLNESALPIKP